MPHAAAAPLIEGVPHAADLPRAILLPLAIAVLEAYLGPRTDRPTRGLVR